MFLTESFTDEGRRLMNSRIVRKPIMLMKRRLAQVLGKPLPAEKIGLYQLEEIQDTLKFMIYSAHDTQIDNIFVWLHPNNLQTDYFPYASEITFNLV